MKFYHISNIFIIYICIILNFSYIVSSTTLRSKDDPPPEIYISLHACCLESSKLLLEFTDINLSINLSNIPISPINITLLSEDNFKYYNVSQRNLYFPGGYQTVTLENNTEFQIEKSNYELSKSFSISKKLIGNTKLSFGVLTNETNITYDKHIKNSLTINVLGSTLSPPFYIIIIATFLFIFSSGLSLSGYTLKMTFTSKETLKSIICGLFCQFILVPIIGISIALIFKQSSYQSFSIFLVAISPGSIILQYLHIILEEIEL